MKHAIFERNYWIIFYFGFLFVLLLTGCQSQETEQAAASIVAEGLQNPLGLTWDEGHLFIAEEGSGEEDDSAGVSLRLPDGTIGRLISNLPSGRDSGDLSGVPLVVLAADGGTLYTTYFGRGALLTLPKPAGGWELPNTPYTEADLVPVMQPLNAVRLINPFDLTFNRHGEPIVSDASSNGVAVRTESDQTRFFHRFDPLPNPGEGKTQIDAVPTGIARLEAEYLVTLTGGCPYPPGSGRLVAIDENRNQRTVLDRLNMPIDVTVGADGTVWLLEFAQFDPEGSCFSGAGYLPESGRLSRINSAGDQEVVVEGLSFPGSMALDDTGGIFISEVFNGRVLYISHLDQIERPQLINELMGEEEVFMPVDAAITTIPAAAEVSSLTFRNVAADRGLDFHHSVFQQEISADPVAMMGGGVCWIDYDQDGWLDLYLINSHAAAEQAYWQESQYGLPENKLYRNENGRFTDVSIPTRTNLAIRGNGCVAADLNQDGWPDLFVTADGPNALLWNNGDGTFTEKGAAAGVAAEEWNTATAVGDLNGDNWPDLFVAAYIDLENKIDRPSGAFPQDYFGLPDHLYVNNRDGTFTDIAAEIGLLHEERGLGAIFSDLDEDGDLDLYIANDGHPNRLYVNNPAANQYGFMLTDSTRTAAVGDSGSGMGVASGDYDGDGRFDLFVTNWEAEVNALYRNEISEAGTLTFAYSTNRIGISGLGNGITGWGTRWADFDHDTDQDLLVVNGRVPISNFDTDPELVRFYGNRLAEGQPNSFREWTQQVGLGQDGVGELLARGSAVADFDNDGDLDVAINVIAGSAVLLENVGVSNHWLMVAFENPQPGIRAIATLADGAVMVRELHLGSSYLASEDPRLHFGLGKADAVKSLRVVFPNGRTISFDEISANQILTISADQR